MILQAIALAADAQTVLVFTMLARGGSTADIGKFLLAWPVNG
jgi:hypothetical protein